MLAPPNRGSEVADRIHRFAPRLILGPALGDLRTTQATSIPPPFCPIGIIAGTRSYLPFTARVMTGSNGGLVSLDLTDLDGADRMVVDAGHTLLMDHPDVIDATSAFIRHSRFQEHARSRRSRQAQIRSRIGLNARKRPRVG